MKKEYPGNKAGEKVVIGEPFQRGARVYIQACRKCGIRTESDHLLVSCQRPDKICNGCMTGELDYYYA